MVATCVLFNGSLAAYNFFIQTNMGQTVHNRAYLDNVSIHSASSGHSAPTVPSHGMLWSIETDRLLTEFAPT